MALDEVPYAQLKAAETFVFRVDLCILAIIAVVALYRLPGGIALLGSQEWLNGHILRHVPYRPVRSPSKRVVQASRSLRRPTSPTSPKGHHHHDVTSDESHTLAYHQQNFQRVDSKGNAVAMEYPTHIASCPSFLRWTLSTLRTRITATHSVGQIILLMSYFWILVYATVFRSNLFVSYARVGWVATAQFPFVVAYAAKNNILGSLWGYGYEKLNFIHRFVGRAIVVAANLHSFGHIYEWSLAGTFVIRIREPDNAWGLFALICLNVLWLSSLQFFRQRIHNVFIITHILCFAFIMLGVALHRPDLVLYIVATLAIFGLDFILRLVKTRITSATIRPLPELDLTRIEIPNINAGWRAGQHVRIRILSSGMGWFGWAEMHPFTIASVGASRSSQGGTSRRGGGGGGGEEGMVLMCKKTGKWTTRLFEMAKLGGYIDGFSGRQIKVWVEGPYGGPGHKNFASYSAAVIVAGGSGITFGLSVIKDLVEKDLKGKTRLKSIELVWTIQDPGALVPLLPTLTSLIQQSIFTPLRISVHYTRATMTVPSFSHIPRFTFSPGRPRLPRIVDHAVQRALSVGVQYDNPQVHKSNSKSEKAGHVGRSKSGSGSRRERDIATYGMTEGKKGTGTGNRVHGGDDVEMGGGIREKEDIQDITGVIVGVCGPVELGKDVMSAVASIDKERRNRVGGIEVHEE
ncbi:hypothetical protein AGABI2DRAFT_123337 [Agaricus bisporus var. bisporus H97]|uniref:hypothetical protein n=1 Tax=Agaricus bisporus var. bisporus (strain H97 / ATCC MYA-4626 / FGSC 10389) TaxID=936046 RepID=UPI00029F553F|nr:hypothetical protein AGABI2DRAFT_123337 [Agaricus bisporus var. bisporus H97]EKV41862.1 hypothetical protein AGABI2DRAFT_123337 [Agaricus bisporus var. bisporus H97]